MKTVHKFQVKPGEVAALDLNTNDKVLCVANQNELPTMWVERDPELPTRKRAFMVVPTGGDVPSGGSYVGTAICSGGRLVWHVYELAC